MNEYLPLLAALALLGGCLAADVLAILAARLGAAGGGR